MKQDLLAKVFEKRIVDRGTIAGDVQIRHEIFRKSILNNNTYIAKEVLIDFNVTMTHTCPKSVVIYVTPDQGAAYLMIISKEKPNNSYVIKQLKGTETDSLIDVTEGEMKTLVNEFLGGL